MQQEMYVTKRNGELELLDLDKLHKVLFWATEDLSGVSVSDIEMVSKIQFYPNMKTTEIHNIMIKATEELISVDHPNYQYVASRLLLFNLRKQVLGQFTPIHIKTLIEKNIEHGVYDKNIISYYSEEEWDKINSFIQHDRDYSIAIAGLKQMLDKYLVQDRQTKTIYETPQYAFMLIAAIGFKNYPKDTRLKYVKKFYNTLSKFEISLPTPVMAGVRTPIKQYSSCVLIDCEDSLDGIIDAGASITKYAAKRAGIGINGGRIRAINSKIRNGEVVHTGLIPFYKKFERDLKCCSQGGIRDSSATCYVPIWHYEIEDVIVLKNNKGSDDNRVRRLDYAIQLDTYFVKRALSGKKITLFSPGDVPDLYEAFFDKDREKFESLYEQYERNKSIRKLSVDARELLINMLNERQETGRLYTMMVDHSNTHSVFLDPVYMSNLCVEITLPTKPVRNIINESNNTISFEGLIQLCTLAAINFGMLKRKEDIEQPITLLVRFLNELLDYQEYPIPQAQNATKQYRPLGIGVINYAYWIAKQGLHYWDQETYDLTHQYAEAMYYYSLKASMTIAKERGEKLPSIDRTIYDNGGLLIDNYKKDIDRLITVGLEYDWEELRNDIKEHGVYNSTLLALMPAESSAVVSNSTNGIEPIRNLITKKKNKNISMTQLAPEANKLKNQYDFLWDLTPNKFEGYLNNMGIFQKFVCQSISTNTAYNPEHFENNKIPMETILKHFLLTIKNGTKTLYYANTKDKEDEDSGQEGGCSDGACKI